MSALASVSLASCVNDEAMENTTNANDNQQRISFNTPIVDGTTRAVAGEQPKDVIISDGKQTFGQYSTKENFKVYAFWSKEQFSSWTANGEVAKLYMNDVEVAHENNDWAPEHVSGGNVYYWPKTGYLTFAAYSPADASSFTHTYGTSGLTITDFTVKDNVSEQYDLMFSERSYNRTQSVNTLDPVVDVHTGKTYNGVDILFKHALSSIKFKVKACGTYTGTSINITGISILNAYYKGTFNENYDETNKNNEDAAWTVSTTDDKDYTVWTGTQAVTTTAQDLTNISDVILLPQNLKHSDTDRTLSVAVKVNYTITNSENVTLQQEAILYLDDQNSDKTNDDYYDDQETNQDITAWEMGKRYIYTICIGLDAIYFSPEVYYWDNVYVTPEIHLPTPEQPVEEEATEEEEGEGEEGEGEGEEGEGGQA